MCNLLEKREQTQVSTSIAVAPAQKRDSSECERTLDGENRAERRGKGRVLENPR